MIEKTFYCFFVGTSIVVGLLLFSLWMWPGWAFNLPAYPVCVDKIKTVSTVVENGKVITITTVKKRRCEEN